MVGTIKEIVQFVHGLDVKNDEQRVATSLCGSVGRAPHGFAWQTYSLAIHTLTYAIWRIYGT